MQHRAVSPGTIVAALAMTALFVAPGKVIAAADQEFSSPAIPIHLIPPAGWLRVPEALVAEKLGEPVEPKAIAAFSSTGVLTPPMLVISRIDDAGRTSANINEELSHDASLKLGTPGHLLLHDPQRKAVITTEPIQTRDGRKFQRVTAFRPYLTGIAHLDFYLPEKNMPGYVNPVFRTVLGTLTVPAALDETSRPPGALAEMRQKLMANPLLRMSMIFGFIAVIGGLLRRRKRRGSGTSD